MVKLNGNKHAPAINQIMASIDVLSPDEVKRALRRVAKEGQDPDSDETQILNLLWKVVSRREMVTK